MADRNCTLAACLFGLCLIAYIPAVVSGPAENESRFRRTVSYLQQASPEERGDFAFTGLTELAQAHAREAALAREELQQHGRDEKLLGWSIAVDQYANELLLLREYLVPGFPPEMSMEDNQPLTLLLGDRSIILSHPRSDQQSAFEHAILFEFCARHDCNRFTIAEVERKPIPVSSGKVRPAWVFSVQGPLCSYRNIEVQFSNTSQMAMSRRICEQFLQEVMTLDNELAWQRRHAVVVDWDYLTIAATPGQPEHMVRLNSLGDTVLSSLPVLYRSKGLLQQIIPWLRNRESGESGESEGGDALLELNAGHYGWEGLELNK